MLRSLIPVRWQSPPVVQVASNPGAVEMAAVGVATYAASGELAQTPTHFRKAFQLGIFTWENTFQIVSENPGMLFKAFGILAAAYVGLVLFNSARNVYGLMHWNGDSFGSAVRQVARSYRYWR